MAEFEQVLEQAGLEQVAEHVEPEEVVEQAGLEQVAAEHVEPE